MADRPAIKSFSEMLVVHTTRDISPPDPQFGCERITIAVTVPGGYTGYGKTPDAACRMAVSMAKMAYADAHRLVGGLSEREWFKAIFARYTPALFAYYLDLARQATVGVAGDCDNPMFESDEAVTEILRLADELAPA